MIDIVEWLRKEAELIALDRLSEAADEIERLRTFAYWVIKEGPFNASHLCGGEIQDKAVELGILIATKYDPVIHGESNSDVEPGDEWFVFVARPGN